MKKPKHICYFSGKDDKAVFNLGAFGQPILFMDKGEYRKEFSLKETKKLAAWLNQCVKYMERK